MQQTIEPCTIPQIEPNVPVNIWSQLLCLWGMVTVDLTKLPGNVPMATWQTAWVTHHQTATSSTSRTFTAEIAGQDKTDRFWGLLLVSCYLYSFTESGTDIGKWLRQQYDKWLNCWRHRVQLWIQANGEHFQHSVKMETSLLWNLANLIYNFTHKFFGLDFLILALLTNEGVVIVKCTKRFGQTVLINTHV